MSKYTLEAFSERFALLEIAFGAQDEARMKGYHGMFAKHDLDALEFAFGRCIKELDRFPVPKQILERLPGHLNLQTQAENAWARVLYSATDGPDEYCPSTGTLPTGADLDEKELDCAGGVRGLKRILSVSDDQNEIGFLRRDFISRYEAYTRTARAGLPAGRDVKRIGAGEPKRLFGGQGDE